MRKFLLGFVMVLLVCCMCVAASAQEHENHCVCGGAAVGVGDHTQCADITWQPLSEALKSIGQTMDAADFGYLPSGNYYLDGNVTVKKASAIGYKKDNLALQPDDIANINLCLNGYTINTETTRVFGYLNMQSSLTICDCSYENGVFKGAVNGGNYSYGGVIYTYSDSYLTIYGGNFTGKGTTNGGTLVIANDGCGDVDGNGKYEGADRNKAKPGVFKFYNGHITGSSVSATGGTIQLFHTAQMYMYGGTVVGGAAAGGNGTIAFGSCKAYLLGGKVIGGTSKGAQELAQVIKNDGQLVGTYTSFKDALSKAQNSANSYVSLINDVEATDTVSGTLYIDLNGFDLTGITITGTVYGMDSATKSYDGTKAGHLLPASGKPQTHVKTAESQVGGVYRYLTLEDENGYSFHRFYMAVTKVSLRPAVTGVGYKAMVIASEQVRQQLAASSGYGYRLWLDPGNKVARGFPGEKLVGTQEMTLRINNYLSAEKTAEENTRRGEQPVYASVYLRLKDGTMIETEPVAYSFRDMLELADLHYSDCTQNQKAALTNLSAKYSKSMMAWDISNTHHVTGSMWTSVDTAGFKAKLTKYGNSGTFYTLAAGSYVLSEDIDLGNWKIRIASGKTINICLNGHTLKTTNRVFEPYGTLNICDCHHDGQEGTVCSSLAGETGTYAAVAYCRYGAVINLYGGNLKATGKVTAAGVFAVSHDGGTANASKPAAIMNMYGGTISGGSVYTNGGLISVWNKGTFNMYGGELYGGSAGNRGGAIDGNSGIVNLMGGKITNCTTEGYGGGVYCVGDKISLEIGSCSITGNTALKDGGGVYLSNSSMTVSGKAIVKDNTGGNLFVYKHGRINADGLTVGAEVKVTNTSMMSVGEDMGSARYISSDTGYKTVNAYGKVILLPDDLTPVSDVSGFQVGFGESNITPKTIEGMPLAGYSNSANRLAKASVSRKSYDDIMAQSVAVTDENGTTVILIYCDLITCTKDFTSSIVYTVSVATGVPEDHIFLNMSHSHSVPSTATTSVDAVVEYNKTLPDLFARSALQAMHDRQPATMETGSFEVQQTVNGKTQYYNFYRHYTTEVDGVLQYFGDQFGTAVYNSTTKPIRDADHTMHLVKFTRDGKDILMANWRIHPHFTGGESAYKLSADAIGTIRYYMAQKLPDAHFIYFQGAAGNMNENSRLTQSRANSYGSQVQSHGLSYVKYGEAVAGIIVKNLSCLESAETGLIQVDHYDYLAKVDTPSDEEYTKAKTLYDIYVVETEGMTLGEKNTWVKNYCKEHPEYNFISGFQLGFIVNRRATESDDLLPLNVVTIGKDFGLFTAPGEMWDAISMEVEDKTAIRTVFCLGYSMAHYHYFAYYPEYADMPNGVPYVSYESENRHFVAPNTVQDMIQYWSGKLNELYENVK